MLTAHHPMTALRFARESMQRYHRQAWNDRIARGDAPGPNPARAASPARAPTGMRRLVSSLRRSAPARP